MKAVAKKTSEVVEYAVVDGKYVVTELKGERTLSESTFKRQFKIVEEEEAVVEEAVEEMKEVVEEKVEEEEVVAEEEVEETEEDLEAVSEMEGNDDIADSNETVESVKDDDGEPMVEIEPMEDEPFEDWIRRTIYTLEEEVVVNLEGDIKDLMRVRDSARVAFLENKKSYERSSDQLLEGCTSDVKEVMDECNVLRGDLIKYANRARKYLSRYDQASAKLKALRAEALLAAKVAEATKEEE